MVIVFGDDISYAAPFRCRFCGSRQANTGEGPFEADDPVCERANQGGAGHSWLEADNPLSRYFREVVVAFWRDECQSKPWELTSPEQYKAKMKLEKELEEAAPMTKCYFGVSVRLAWVKPPAK
jgi:hypothetical protein